MRTTAITVMVITSKGPVAAAETIPASQPIIGKPTDNSANVALHKERYLHFIQEKYYKMISHSSSLRKSRGEHFLKILEKTETGTAKERFIIKERKFKVNLK